MFDIKSYNTLSNNLLSFISILAQIYLLPLKKWTNMEKVCRSNNQINRPFIGV